MIPQLNEHFDQLVSLDDDRELPVVLVGSELIAHNGREDISDDVFGNVHVFDPAENKRRQKYCRAIRPRLGRAWSNAGWM